MFTITFLTKCFVSAVTLSNIDLSARFALPFELLNAFILSLILLLKMILRLLLWIFLLSINNFSVTATCNGALSLCHLLWGFVWHQYFIKIVTEIVHWFSAHTFSLDWNDILTSGAFPFRLRWIHLISLRPLQALRYFPSIRKFCFLSRSISLSRSIFWCLPRRIFWQIPRRRLLSPCGWKFFCLCRLLFWCFSWCRFSYRLLIIFENIFPIHLIFFLLYRFLSLRRLCLLLGLLTIMTEGASLWCIL